MHLQTENLCSHALNGQQALNKVIDSVNLWNNKKCGFDLILMDCNMPFMDGYEATREIRQYLYTLNIRQPIIVAVTGHTEPEYVKTAIESGMNMVLSKPVDKEVLKKIIHKVRIYGKI
jgi:CheY-like chemotaxis protein